MGAGASQTWSRGSCWRLCQAPKCGSESRHKKATEERMVQAGKDAGHKQVRARGVGRGGWQGRAQPPWSWRALKGKCAEHQRGAGRVKTPHQQLCSKAGMAARDTGMGGPGQDRETPLLWGQGGRESMSVCGGASGNGGGSAPFPGGGELISGGRIPGGASRGPRGLQKGWEKGHTEGNTCLNKVFSLKNISNFIHDDVVLSPSKSIEMHMLNHHLDVIRGHKTVEDKTRQKIRRQGQRQMPKVTFKDFLFLI